MERVPHTYRQHWHPVMAVGFKQREKFPSPFGGRKILFFLSLVEGATVPAGLCVFSVILRRLILPGRLLLIYASSNGYPYPIDNFNVHTGGSFKPSPVPRSCCCGHTWISLRLCTPLQGLVSASTFLVSFNSVPGRTRLLQLRIRVSCSLVFDRTLIEHHELLTLLCDCVDPCSLPWALLCALPSARGHDEQLLYHVPSPSSGLGSLFTPICWGRSLFQTLHLAGKVFWCCSFHF